MSVRGWLVLALALLAVAACGDEDPRTQVMLEIDADPAVRVRLQTLRVLIDVSDDEGESWQKRISKTYRPGDVGGDWREFAWPARLGLVPAEGRGQRQFAVRVQALDRKGELYVWQQAVAKFTAGRTTVLEITLVDRCTIAALACGDEDCVGTDGCETCRAGKCVDVELLDELPEFDPDSTGSLFDGSVPIGRDGGPPDAGRGPLEDAAEPEPDSGNPPDDAGSTGPSDSGVMMDSGPIDSGQDAASDTGTSPEPFTVTASTPSAGAPVLSDVRGALSVTYSAPVDGATVTASSFSVQHEGRAVAGALASSARSTTFTPDQPWVLSGAYTLSLTAAIKDQDGTTLTPLTLGFEIRDGVWSRNPVFDGLGDPKLALASDGYGVLEYVFDTGGTPEVRASLFTPPAAWSQPLTLTTSGASASVVAINTRHHAVAVWSGISAGQTASVWTGGPSWGPGASVSPGADADVFLSATDEAYFVASDVANGEALDGYQFTLGAAFPAAIPIAMTTSANRGSQIGVVGGASVLVWQHSSGAGLSQIKAGNLSSADGVTLSGAGAVATAPSMAVNAAQTAAVVVWLQASQATPGETRLWASRLVASGSWSAAQTVSSGTAPAQFPMVAVDNSGRAVATWTEAGAIRSSAFDPGTSSWSAPAPVSATGIVDNEKSSVVLAPDGNGLAVWAQNSAGMSLNEIWASRYLAGRGFQVATRARISDLEAGTGDIVSLAIDDAGRALAAWYQSNKVWVARFE